MHYLILSMLTLCSLSAVEPVCKKCQIIRDYNESHPENNYYWYDDYLKDLKTKEAKEKSATENAETKSLMACGCNDKKKRGRDRRND